MNVAVINPRSIYSKNTVRDVIYGCWCKGKRIGGGTVLPYWLIMVSTVLKKAGINVDYIDEHVSSEFNPLNYDIVVINTSSMSFNEDAEFLGKLKSINSSIKTIVFGSHPTYMPRYCLERKEIDFIVRSEPEYILRDLIIAIRNNNNHEDIKGIGFKIDEKSIINPPYEYIENLDEMPFLDDSFIPDLVYFNPLIIKYPYIAMITSRGCPGKCIFCPAASFYGNRYRWQSPDRVVDEMEHFFKKGYKEVYFRDETFTFSKKRIRAICELLLKRKIKLNWICNARVGTLDYDLIKQMKAAGCRWIKFGIESGSQEILTRAKKGITVEEILKTFMWARKAGVNTHAHFMVGMPGETEETLRETIGFSRKIKPATASFGICTPYPGTELFETVSALHPEIKDGTDADFSSLHLQGYYNEEYADIAKEKLHKAVILAYRKFYVRLSYALDWLLRIRSLSELKPILLAGVKILDFVFRGDQEE
jgi:radical SAM superfamily enzyme YgiQ (UPF0313 family)